ncbi:MAG: hypothetical protein J0665_04240, partial [Deltaproteobacteria bacterium]|nr:hypothetical protein [Deltaproteobacteria bacterium]
TAFLKCRVYYIFTRPLTSMHVDLDKDGCFCLSVLKQRASARLGDISLSEHTHTGGGFLG